MRTTKLKREISDLAHRRWTIVEARRVVSAWRRSGLPLGEFARRYGVQAQRMRLWSRRVALAPQQRAPVPAATLVPVTVRQSVVEAAVVVRLPTGVAVEIADGERASAQWISSLVSELSR
jgi:hypothetical protein